FQVQLKALSGPTLFTDCGGVQLGVVALNDEGPLGWEISNPREKGRTYAGIRAQRVIAPDHADAKSDPFDITAMKAHYLPDHPHPGYLDVHPSVFNRGNVVVKKNLVVGDDFELDQSS